MSKRAVLLQVLLTASILIPVIVSGQIHLSGSLSGILPDTSYIIDGDIRVENRNSLIIEPGAEFFFNGYYEFLINGYIQAVGTEEDSIIFRPAEGILNWSGFRFDEDSDDSSFLSYCIITGGLSSGGSYLGCGGGVLIYFASPTFYRCTITENGSGYHGGGVYCYGDWMPFSCNPEFIECVISDNQTDDDGAGMAFNNSDALIQDCLITGNYSTGDTGEGGGICLGESSSLITGCVISGNSCCDGGGICVGWSLHVMIKNCQITGNTAEFAGGGVAFDEESYNIRLDSCKISENSAGWEGGGLMVASGSTRITNSLISRNSAIEKGGAIGILGADFTLENCTITDNSGGQAAGTILFYSFVDSRVSNCIVSGNHGRGALIHFNNTEPSGQIEYNNLYGNEGGIFTGRWRQELGMVQYTNANGDSCDRYRNIYLDPLFVDPIAGDYHLLAGSPCIDAGDPNSDFDPDWTIADMGAYYFDQSLHELSLGISNSSDAVQIENCILLPISPNPFNAQSTVEYSLPSADLVSLKLYNVLGKEVVSLYEGFQGEGSHRAVIDGSALSSGIYWLRLQTSKQSMTTKVLLVK